MLKKILLTSIALSLYLNANSNLNENISCAQEYEICATKCESIESYEKNIIWMEKCELSYDKCESSSETNVQILNDDENKDTYEPEKESN